MQRPAGQLAIWESGIDIGQAEPPRRGLNFAGICFRRGLERTDLPAQSIEQAGAVAPGRGVARVLRLLRGG